MGTGKLIHKQHIHKGSTIEARGICCTINHFVQIGNQSFIQAGKIMPNAHLFCRFANIWVYCFGFPGALLERSDHISPLFMDDKDEIKRIYGEYADFGR